MQLFSAQFWVSFSQLPAVKKDTENCAPGNFFGPSYFVTTLEKTFLQKSKKQLSITLTWW